MRWSVAIRARVGGFDLDVELDGGPNPVVVIGPNGSGKTTILRLIAGALTPSSGRIQVGARTLFDSTHGVDAPPEDRHVGYVPQGYALFQHLSAVDNVAFGLRYRSTAESNRRRRQLAAEALERLGCAHVADRTARSLSGGEQQRVALARALVVAPELLLLDEPLAALDAGARRRMRTFLVEHLAARGRPTIVVSHDPRDVVALASEVFAVEAGRVVQRGTAHELRADPKTDFIAELFDASHAAAG